VKSDQEKRQRKPLKRVYQAPGCVIRAKIKRMRAHLEKHTDDRAARLQLEKLERSLE
jgi:hypothetical protein